MKPNVGRRQRVVVWLGLACLVLVVGLGGGCQEEAPPPAQQPKLRATLEAEPVISVAFSPDGKTLASGGASVKLWDVASGKNTVTLKGHTAAVTSVAFSPDGKTLASGSWDKTVKLWDVASG